RDGARRDVDVQLGTLPGQRQASLDQPRQEEAKPTVTALQGFGLSLSPGKDGVVISKVDANGPAADLGIREGDVVLSVGGRWGANRKEVERAGPVAGRGGRKSVLFRIKSGDGSPRFIGLPIGRS